MASRNRGKPKLSLRDYSRLHASDEEQSAIYNLLPRLPPVALAVLGAAMTEQELETTLRRRLTRRDDETWREITEDNGPLRSFHTKILAAYALGIIDAISRENLQVVRRIRNAFAHAKKPLTFDNPLITDELARVRPPAKVRRGQYEFVAGEHRDHREAYAVLCLAINNMLLRKLVRAETAKGKRLRRRLQVEFKKTPKDIADILMRELTPSQKAILSDDPQPSRGHQNDNPTTEEGAKSPDTAPLKSNALHRKAGK